MAKVTNVVDTGDNTYDVYYDDNTVNSVTTDSPPSVGESNGQATGSDASSSSSSSSSDSGAPKIVNSFTAKDGSIVSEMSDGTYQQDGKTIDEATYNQLNTSTANANETPSVAGSGAPTTLSSIISKMASGTLKSSDITSFLSANAGNAAVLTGLAALTGGNTVTTGAYQGSIPKLQAIRNQISAGVPAGQSQQYFTDTRYVNPADANAVGAAQSASQTQAQAIIDAAKKQAAATAASQPPVAGFAMPWVNQTAAGNTPVTQGNNAGLPAVIDASSPGYTNKPQTGIGTVVPVTTTVNPGTTITNTGGTTTNTGGTTPGTTKTSTLTPAQQLLASLQNPTASGIAQFQAGTPSQITSGIQNALAAVGSPGTPAANKTIAGLMDTWKVTPTEMAAATGLTAGEITNLYNQAKGITATPQITSASNIQSELANAASAFNSGNPSAASSGIATINNIIAANPGLSIDQIQAMFPQVDLSQYLKAGAGTGAAGASTYQYGQPMANQAGMIPVVNNTPASTGAQPMVNGSVQIPVVDNTPASTNAGVAAIPVNTSTNLSNFAAAPVTPAAPAAPTTADALAAYQAGNYAQAAQDLGALGMSAQDVVSQYGLSPTDAATVASNLGYTGDLSNLTYSAPADNSASFGYDTGAKAGGLMDLHYAHGGETPMQPRYLQGTTDGMADKVPSSIDGVEPAKLSHGEFVIPADVVSHLGNGNSDAGAKKLYEMMDKVRVARTGTKKQGKEINPDKFMIGGSAYAGGGAVAFNTGGISDIKGYAGPTGSTVSSGATGTSSGVTTPSIGYSTVNALSPWAGDYVTNMLGSAQALANSPMPVYQGQLTAGPSALQNQQFAGLSDLAKTGAPPIQFTTGTWSNQGAAAMPDLATPSQTQSVSQAANQGIAKFNQPMQLDTSGNTGIAAQYMNPYLQQSLQPQLNLLAQTAATNEQADLGKLTSQGAFGGSRQAVLQGMDQNALLGQQANLIGQGYNTAYNNAQQQFNNEQQLNQQAQLNQQNANQASATFGLNTLNALGTAGGIQQGLTQAADTAAQNQFNQQALYPYQQLQFEQSMLSNLPISTQAVVPNTSPISNVAGTVNTSLSLADLLKNLNITP